MTNHNVLPELRDIEATSVISTLSQPVIFGCAIDHNTTTTPRCQQLQILQKLVDGRPRATTMLSRTRFPSEYHKSWTGIVLALDLGTDVAVKAHQSHPRSWHRSQPSHGWPKLHSLLPTRRQRISRHQGRLHCRRTVIFRKD